MTDYGVVIPAFNAELTLRETLESVLAKTVAAAEIVVVDDGSTDGTADLAASVSPRIRVVRQANAGPGAATSRGVHELRSPWSRWSTPTNLAANEDGHPVTGAQRTQGSLWSARRMRQFRHGQIDDYFGECRPGPTRSTIVVRREVFLRWATSSMTARPYGRASRLAGTAANQGHRMHALDEVLALAACHFRQPLSAPRRAARREFSGSRPQVALLRRSKAAEELER